MSDNKVTLDQLDNSAIEAMAGSIGDVNMLNTENKTIVGALAEIVGKKEIANAIGEPLAETDKFTEMSDEINGLLSTFKTNMMNAGVVVESSDKFKQLIDKIKGLTEGEGNKGVKFAEGSGNWSVGSIGDNSGNHTLTIETNLDFTPTLVICYVDSVKFYTYDTVNQTYNKAFLSNTKGISYGSLGISVTIRNIKPESFDIVTIGTTDGQAQSVLASGITNWYAIGVGEEDTTLRDSLASILENKGIVVTEEDDLASLISKVDTDITKPKLVTGDTLKLLDLDPISNVSLNECNVNTPPIVKSTIITTDFIDQFDVQSGKMCITGTIYVNYGSGSYENSYATVTMKLYRNGELVQTIWDVEQYSLERNTVYIDLPDLKVNDVIEYSYIAWKTTNSYDKRIYFTPSITCDFSK